MTDYFALLSEMRRPWLDPEPLKAKFLQLSGETHPDRFHGAPEGEKMLAHKRYLEFNAAYRCLREPKDRLLHLLELERGARPKEVQQLGAAAAQRFGEVAQLCRNVDDFIAERAETSSPLLRVQKFEGAAGWADKLRALQDRINAERDALFGELVAMNAAWEAAPPVGSRARPDGLSLGHLEEIYQTLSFIARWTVQLQERIVQLSQ